MLILFILTLDLSLTIAGDNEFTCLYDGPGQVEIEKVVAEATTFVSAPAARYTPADAETTAAIRSLVAEATAIHPEDLRAWDVIRRATAFPKPRELEAAVDRKSLSLVLYLTQPQEDRLSQQAFRHLVKGDELFARPADLMQEMVRNGDGPITMLRNDRVKRFTCQLDARDERKAVGEIEFEAPELYAGRVTYVARQQDDGAWRIEEFLMPPYGIRLVLDDEGIWRRK